MLPSQPGLMYLIPDIQRTYHRTRVVSPSSRNMIFGILAFEVLYSRGPEVSHLGRVFSDWGGFCLLRGLGMDGTSLIASHGHPSKTTSTPYA